MKNITSSVYDFEKLIQNDYLYIDKTEYIWKLIRRNGESYFLSRPRRFGKSLTISTLKAVFEGRKDLFEGLAISQKDYDWKKYPVIHLSFGDFTGAETRQGVKEYLTWKVKQTAKEFSVSITSDEPGLCLGQLIDALKQESQVVILVDEYDKPLIDNIQNPDAASIREELKAFYSVLKDRNAALRLLFVTGVTKFSHVSLFSGVNNLTDISMNADYAVMLGYTQNEFETNFAGYIEQACQQTGMTREELLAAVKDWYDGFRFEESAESVYNPVSLAQFFENKGKFNNYWFATGTPSFLMKIIRKNDFDFEKVLTEPVNQLAFSAYEVTKLDPLALLLQTGYLTIKDSFRDFNQTFYNLDFPNYEVRFSFNTYLLNAYTDVEQQTATQYIIEMARSVRSGKAEVFMDAMKTYFANIPYDIQLANEKYYQTVFLLIFWNLGINITAEVRTNNGRIDAVAECGNNVYIFEFKINQSAEIAMQQIREMEYFRKYQHSGKDITLIGANFNTEKRELESWLIGKA